MISNGMKTLGGFPIWLASAYHRQVFDLGEFSHVVAVKGGQSWECENWHRGPCIASVPSQVDVEAFEKLWRDQPELMNRLFAIAIDRAGIVLRRAFAGAA